MQTRSKELMKYSYTAITLRRSAQSKCIKGQHITVENVEFGIN